MTNQRIRSHGLTKSPLWWLVVNAALITGAVLSGMKITNSTVPLQKQKEQINISKPSNEQLIDRACRLRTRAGKLPRGTLT